MAKKPILFVFIMGSKSMLRGKINMNFTNVQHFPEFLSIFFSESGHFARCRYLTEKDFVTLPTDDRAALQRGCQRFIDRGPCISILSQGKFYKLACDVFATIVP